MKTGVATGTVTDDPLSRRLIARERGDAAGLRASPISFQTRVSKAPAASNDIASWSPPSAARASNTAIDSDCFTLCLSLKSVNFLTMT